MANTPHRLIPDGTTVEVTTHNGGAITGVIIGGGFDRHTLGYGGHAIAIRVLNLPGTSSYTVRITCDRIRGVEALEVSAAVAA